MIDDPDEQAVLFELPDAPRVPPKLAASPQRTRATYTAYTPKLRRLCDDCVRDIHRLGVALAPLPSSVRWRRTHAGVTDLLCPRHKRERVSRDADS